MSDQDREAFDFPLPSLVRGERTVQVTEELGIPVVFDLNDKKFHAQIGSADVHADDIDVVISRIRKRALIEPVRAYHVYETSVRQSGPGGGSSVPVLKVSEVAVSEFHQGRHEPYIYRHVDRAEEGMSYRSRYDGRSAEDTLYLPTVEQLLAYARLMDEEEAMKQRHAQEAAAMKQRKAATFSQIKVLTPAHIKAAQADGTQPIEAGIDRAFRESLSRE